MNFESRQKKSESRCKLSIKIEIFEICLERVPFIVVQSMDAEFA